MLCFIFFVFFYLEALSIVLLIQLDFSFLTNFLYKFQAVVAAIFYINILNKLDKPQFIQWFNHYLDPITAYTSYDTETKE